MQDEDDAAAFVANDPYAKAGLFKSTFVTQLAELDVTGQHLDRQWEKFQLEGKRVFTVGWGDGGMGGLDWDRPPWGSRHTFSIAFRLVYTQRTGTTTPSTT